MGNWSVQASPQSVQGWSAERLKFDHRPAWMDEFRSELRRGLAAMRADSGVLHAVYTSSVAGLADAENVLFYNVGEGAFAGLTQRGIRFERSFRSASPLAHHHHYEMTQSDSARCWKREVELASFTDVKLPLVPSLKHVWLALHRAASVTVRLGSPLQHFGLSLRVTTPKPVNLAKWIKPIFDGVICAFHQYAGPPMAETLSGQLEISPQDAAGLLAETRLNALGPRRIVYPRGVGVQWNPADDLCQVGELLRVGDGPWAISGSLYSVREVLKQSGGAP